MQKISGVIVMLTIVALLSPIVLAGDNEKKRFELKTHIDGTQTVIDNATGLEWEMKVAGTVSDNSNPSLVENRYRWSASLSDDPNGDLFTDYLARMNCVKSTDHICGPGSHTDWRIPTVAELTTIVDCTYSPCIDPIFGPIRADDFFGGAFWTRTVSASTSGTSLDAAYIVRFSDGTISHNVTPASMFVRAVRGGL